MKKIILLALACTGFVVTTPFTAHALDSEKIGQNLHLEPNMSLALAEPLLDERIAQYRRNQNRDRQFSVYYRNRGVRQWTLEGYHATRRDAQNASNRLQRRGYRTYIQVSRRVYGGMNRG
ncbi:hypothetical protein [Chamaesiphon sp.]|uniref:hypothetical protein n=1 Tax=Chamaesiphon sp. TaxID=2814140 RepID=UPI00359459EB